MGFDGHLWFAEEFQNNAQTDYECYFIISILARVHTEITNIETFSCSACFKSRFLSNCLISVRSGETALLPGGLNDQLGERVVAHYVISPNGTVIGQDIMDADLSNKGSPIEYPMRPCPYYCMLVLCFLDLCK